jgi:hypothetical protein
MLSILVIIFIEAYAIGVGYERDAYATGSFDYLLLKLPDCCFFLSFFLSFELGADA